jgi:uncharacterized protein Smg (DUF494 family)
MDIARLVKDAQDLKEELLEAGLSQDEYDDALDFLEQLLEKQKK